MADEQLLGVKESKEALVAAVSIGFEIYGLAKDGLQFSDLASLYDLIVNDAELKAKFDAAVAGAGQIPAEMKEISVKEALELVMAVASEAVAKLDI